MNDDISFKQLQLIIQQIQLTNEILMLIAQASGVSAGLLEGLDG